VVFTQNKEPSPAPKPISATWHPELTHLPVLTPGRRFFRRAIKLICKAALFIFTRATIQGLENYPRHDPALIIINHLGDTDAVLELAVLPDFPEVMGKIELRSVPVLRKVMDLLGIIWLHRGKPDRRAISAALEAFAQGRRVIIAPEGRESVSGALEQGLDGAAFLALKAGVPVVPITLTGTEFRRIENNMGKFRRTPVTIRIGEPFYLSQAIGSIHDNQTSRKENLREGTRILMETLARQLPFEYRGAYGYIKD